MWSLTFKDIHTAGICSREYAIEFGSGTQRDGSLVINEAA